MVPVSKGYLHVLLDRLRPSRSCCCLNALSHASLSWSSSWIWKVTSVSVWFGMSDTCSFLDLLVFLLCSCSARYILTLVLCWSLEQVCTFYPRVLPKAVSMYHFRLFPRAPLNPVHNIIKPFHNNICPLHGCLNFAETPFFPGGLWRHTRSPLPKVDVTIRMSYRLFNLRLPPCWCTWVTLWTVPTDSLNLSTYSGAQLAGSRVHANPIQTWSLPE